MAVFLVIARRVRQLRPRDIGPVAGTALHPGLPPCAAAVRASRFSGNGVANWLRPGGALLIALADALLAPGTSSRRVPPRIVISRWPSCGGGRSASPGSCATRVPAATETHPSSSNQVEELFAKPATNLSCRRDAGVQSPLRTTRSPAAAFDPLSAGRAVPNRRCCLRFAGGPMSWLLKGMPTPNLTNTLSAPKTSNRSSSARMKLKPRASISTGASASAPRRRRTACMWATAPRQSRPIASTSLSPAPR